jgi:hypothetical protein
MRRTDMDVAFRTDGGMPMPCEQGTLRVFGISESVRVRVGEDLLVSRERRVRTMVEGLLESEEQVWSCLSPQLNRISRADESPGVHPPIRLGWPKDGIADTEKRALKVMDVALSSFAVGPSWVSHLEAGRCP